MSDKIYQLNGKTYEFILVLKLKSFKNLFKADSLSFKNDWVCISQEK